ncbi:uncharacterized protein [Penaeus vannamei]|uniref:uncharacterized protein n=1 Tax=Penaeus vannamei TaxID=6689 RepID=UPI00387FAB02
MIILMGIRDEELIQKLICLPSHSPLQDMVKTCKSFEATKSATSDIHAIPNQLCAVSAYQKKKKGQYRPNPSPPISTPRVSCQFCARRHDSGKCPAANSICNNCGRHSHWARTSKCPATSIQCRFCNRMGHYEKCGLQDLRVAARVDPSYTRLLDCVSSGFPSNRNDLHSTLLPFWKIRDNLSIDGELVLYGARVVVPAVLHRRTLSRLHDSHRGVESMMRRAKQTVFWPGIDSDITSTVHACESCQMFQPSQQQEPLMCDDNSTWPFESASDDFFTISGKSFLVIADRLSGWPVLVPCKGDTTALNTIRFFCRYFREVGVPLRLQTDGGP